MHRQAAAFQVTDHGSHGQSRELTPLEAFNLDQMNACQLQPQKQLPAGSLPVCGCQCSCRSSRTCQLVRSREITGCVGNFAGRNLP